MQNRIKDIRNRRGLTQKQLAEMVGVKRETIANLESGKYNPSLDVADRIAWKLDCHLYDLFPKLFSEKHYLFELSEKKKQTRDAILEGITRLIQ